MMKKLLLLALTLSTISLWGMKCEVCNDGTLATHKITYHLSDPVATENHYGCDQHSQGLFDAMDGNPRLEEADRVRLAPLEPQRIYRCLLCNAMPREIQEIRVSHTNRYESSVHYLCLSHEFRHEVADGPNPQIYEIQDGNMFRVVSGPATVYYQVIDNPLPTPPVAHPTNPAPAPISANNHDANLKPRNMQIYTKPYVGVFATCAIAGCILLIVKIYKNRTQKNQSEEMLDDTNGGHKSSTIT
jgi:hypothetical protein